MIGNCVDMMMRTGGDDDDYPGVMTVNTGHHTSYSSYNSDSGVSKQHRRVLLCFGSFQRTRHL